MASDRRVLILDGDSRASIAVVRSLAKAGFEIAVLASRRDALCFASKFTSEPLLGPSPLQTPDAYADFVTERVRRGGLLAVIPCAEESIFALWHRLDALRAMTALPLAPNRALDATLDEVELNREAGRIGIHLPRQARIDQLMAIPDIDLDFPVILKPRKKIIQVGRALVHVYSRVARDLDELAYHVRNMHPDAFPCLVQNILMGEPEEYAALYRRGAPVVEFGQRPARELPPTGGLSVPLEAVPPDEKVVAQARRILKELDFDGPVLVKFKRDEPGGEPRLVSVNGYFWPTLQLAVNAGVDFPVLALRAALGEEVTPPVAVSYGLRTRWLPGDIQHLVWYLLKGKRALRLSESAPSRVEALRQFFQDFHDPAMMVEVASADDPAPYRLMRRRNLYDVLRLVRKGLLAWVGFGPNRYKGMIVTLDMSMGDAASLVDALREMMEKRRFHFLCLALSDRDCTQEEIDRFAAHCARHSTDQFLIIPGLAHEAATGVRILSLGALHLPGPVSSKSLARSVRAAGGVAIMAGLRPGDIANNPELVDELNGVEIWSLTRHGSWAPPLDLVEDYIREMERSPYLVAFQGCTLHAPSALPRGHITIHAQLLTKLAVLSALETGLFHLTGTLFRARSDRLSFLLHKWYVALVDKLAVMMKNIGKGRHP